MECDYHRRGECASCTLIDVAYPDQIARKRRRVAAALGVDEASVAVTTGPDARFRNKAKMVAGGTMDSPTLGILDESWHGTDLTRCPLYPEAIHVALRTLSRFVSLARLAPYDVAERRGELKHILVTVSPDDELMVRFVMRSTEAHTRIVKHLPTLLTELPNVRVATLNVLPDHRAALEGEREVVLTSESKLPMRLRGATLYLQPRSFFQTNTGVCEDLYERARGIVAEIAPRSVWDLYCGVGGFALHLAGEDRDVTGVELSPEAIECARLSAAELGDVAGTGLTFLSGDATAFAIENGGAGRWPDLAVVNPPRRGLGGDLSRTLEASSIPAVLYSSCNPTSLAHDLAAMPGFRVESAELFDMFPHTEHAEVLTLLRRR
ncbi:23S rRNA (uracil(747)-C(5))-methyltransferase RlmC [Rarobacter faecitabidus]|uniref:23S rRNA m(5)U-747 methyltransferase n=1 Tax=Rarobacter faecitabidus TaxID=13243 RepID=A0A542ZV26_RARFA|nr:methyltransferase domain-containing protein [Rarobacter faecitabidus]TQL64214.1 23S rRNA m(5)U-747 methyltransferase [Rarobacter faecitabidus]